MSNRTPAVSSARDLARKGNGHGLGYTLSPCWRREPYVAYRIDLNNEVALVTGGGRNIGLAIAWALVEAGNLRLLARFSDARLPRLPQLPTVVELGYDIVVSKFRGLIGPQAPPLEIVVAWERAVQQVSQDPEYRRSYSQAMLSPAFMGQAGFARFIDGFASETEAFLLDTGVIQ